MIITQPKVAAAGPGFQRMEAMSKQLGGYATEPGYFTGGLFSEGTGQAMRVTDFSQAVTAWALSGSASSAAQSDKASLWTAPGRRGAV